LRQWQSKLERAYNRTVTTVESQTGLIIAVVVILSCVAAGFCAPYSLSVARDLLILAVTVFSMFFVAYVFLRNRLQSQVDFAEKEIEDIDRHWSTERYKFAKEAIEGYERAYRLVFSLILSAECLLIVSIGLLIYTVFIGNCWAVETLGLGLIISALVLLILMLLLHHGYPGPEGLFRKLNLYLEAIRRKHVSTRHAVGRKKALSKEG